MTRLYTVLCLPAPRRRGNGFELYYICSNFCASLPMAPLIPDFFVIVVDGLHRRALQQYVRHRPGPSPNIGKEEEQSIT